MRKVTAFLGAWVAISFAIWIILWMFTAAVLVIVKDPFTSIEGIFPFSFGVLTVLGAAVLGLLIAGILAATKAKDDPEKQKKGVVR